MTRRIVKGSAVLAFVLGSAAAVGCGSSSGDKVLSALDSLPNAPVDQQTTQNAAGNAASAAVSAAEVPQASDFASSGTLPTLWAMAVNRLPLAQRPAALAAMQFLGPRATSGTCPVVTDNSTFPTGTGVDVTVDAGAGCTDASGATLSGKMTLKGTIDVATGSVSVDIVVSSFAVSAPCSGGTFKMSMDGTGSTTATGLTLASTSFSITRKLDVTIGFSGTCGGQSASGSGFVFASGTLTGTKSGSTWTFTISETDGTEILGGGAKIGEYAEWKGTVTVDTKNTLTGADDTGTIALTGRVGWDTPLARGKVTVALNGTFNHAVCTRELVTGTLELTSGTNKAVVSFDGNSPTACNQAPWTLNGVPQGILFF